MIGSTNATIIIGGGGGGSKAIIRTAEMPDVTITLSQNGTDIESKSTPATTGGIVDFEISAIGTYTITASGTGITSWNRNVEVTELNTIVECKAGTLANYTYAQWHTALQGGYFSKMFSLRDKFTYSQSGNIFNNHEFFIEDIEKSGASEIVHFRMVSVFSGGGYDIYPQFSFITSSTASSWTTMYRTYGGYKYSAMRQRTMKQGEEVYSQASGILPDDYTGTLTDGIKFSELKYTNGNSCSIYEYNSSTDTMTLLSICRMSQPNKTGMMFIKGYFKSVGAIDETTFNNGVYYTATTYGSTSKVYTKATSYNSGTTYYGLYETLQEDGIFADALANSNFTSYLVTFSESASAGGDQTTSISSYNTNCDMPAVEEITNLNRTKTIFAGSMAFTIGCYNIAGEGTFKHSYDYSVQANNYQYWTRSADTSGPGFFELVRTNGSVNYNAAYDPQRIRLGFRLQ